MTDRLPPEAFLTSPTTAEDFHVAIEEALERHLLPDVDLLERTRADVMNAVNDLISVPCFPCRSNVEGGDEVMNLHPACEAELYGQPPPSLRERVAAAIASYDHAVGQATNPTPSGHHQGQADAVLAVRDREMEQAEAARRIWQGTANRCATEAEQQRERADQVEDLLRVAHDTSNRSEAERARAAQRADRAEATLERVRSECDRIEAAVRANPTAPDFDGAYLAAIGHIRRALDPQEQS